MSRSALTWVVVLALCSAPSTLADTVTLKDTAYVKGPMVTLGELAEIEGDHEETLEAVELVPAPRPGMTKRVTVALIKSRIRNAGFDGEDLTVLGALAVKATTLYREIDSRVIAASLRKHVERQIEATRPWTIEDSTIDLSVPQDSAIIPEGADYGFRWWADPQYGYLGPGVIRGEIIVDGEVAQSFVCRAVVESFDSVMVAIDGIKRGKVIPRSRIEFQKRPLSPLKNGVIRDYGELDGYVARTTIFPGQVISRRNLAPQRIIKRNQIVPVLLATGRLTVQGRAKAMSDGAAGEFIPLLNLQSKKEFVGLVRRDGTIEVQ